MSKIGHGYGSEWHLLRYLGYHRDDLNKAVLDAIDEQEGNKGELEWYDFRFSYTRKALQDDREWDGVEFIRDQNVQHLWRQYWPLRGRSPQWDAVGSFIRTEVKDWLLVEAKAHIGEMESSWHAKDAESQAMIRSAMADTAKAAARGGVPTDAWLDKFYQYANRLAVLNFLCRTCTPAQPARLIFLCFYGESEEAMPGRKCPQNASEWQTYLDTVHSELDIDPQSPLMQRVHHVFVPIHPPVRKMAYLPLFLASRMVADGRAEEVFQILLAEFETYRTTHEIDAGLLYVARQVEDKWRKSDPGEGNVERMKEALKEYLENRSEYSL